MAKILVINELAPEIVRGLFVFGAKLSIAVRMELIRQMDVVGFE